NRNKNVGRLVFLTFLHRAEWCILFKAALGNGRCRSSVQFERAAIVPSASTLSKTDPFSVSHQHRRSQGRTPEASGLTVWFNLQRNVSCIQSPRSCWLSDKLQRRTGGAKRRRRPPPTLRA